MLHAQRYLCCIFLLLAHAAAAQKGDWYTYSTGKTPISHIIIDDDKLVVERTDAAFRQVKLAGRASREGALEEIPIERKINANGKIYVIHLSPDSLFFCTTFKYFKKQDSLLMYCATGADDGYKSAKEVLAAIKADTGTHFSVILYRKEQLDAQRRRTPLVKATEEEFRAGLQQFTENMDKFWQYRGYGRYEPYHAWMSLIYGNAWAEAFDPKFNKLSLDAKNLKTPISKYGNDPAIKKLLEAAGLSGDEK